MIYHSVTSADFQRYPHFEVKNVRNSSFLAKDTPIFKAMLPPIFRHFSYIYSKMAIYAYLSVILSSYLMIFSCFGVE